MRISSITKNAGKACNNRLYRHIRTFEKIIKNYFVICNTNRYTFIVSKRHHQINALLRKKREPIFSNSHKTLGYLYFFSQNCVLEDAVCVILLRIQNGLTHKIVSQFIDVQKRRALWDLKHIGPLCIRSHSTNFR